jgi:hypothetical protein
MRRCSELVLIIGGRIIGEGVIGVRTVVFISINLLVLVGVII